LEHVLHVLVRGKWILRKVLHYVQHWDAKAIRRIFELAAEYHDLGKLDDENQKILSGNKKASRLPIAHADAGVAHLLSQDAPTSALLVFAHHAGLPDCNAIDDMRNKKIKQHVDSVLQEYLARHEESVRPNIEAKTPATNIPELKSPDIRVLFSCLTHADHGDAARASNEEPQWEEPPKLRPAERLEALRRYVAGLESQNDDTDRNRLRTAFFASCAGSQHDSPISICDSPVGTGKTTAVMASLLTTAERHGLRRIFVILPFTNIITQSVRIYRNALTLPGERGEDVVAEIHHRADFEDIASRKLTALWDAPIVVTTAVTFFETLASATPSTLRRLQNLPGSAVFLDEAHAMLPVKLLPLAWQWIQHSASAWSCHWVLASGSLCHFWELEEFGDPIRLPDIIQAGQKEQLHDFEVVRIQYHIRPNTMNLENLAEWLATLDGPIIVVLNTVHTAAAAAQVAVAVFGEENVLHLSTALTPRDREATLELVKTRLKNRKDSRWCFFATSCVEAGVDLSFRTGVRECASLLSLLQLAGRVNRNSEYNESEVWTIMLDANDCNVTRNPTFDSSSRILRDFFDHNMTISPALSTEAMKREVRENSGISTELFKQESIYGFKTVEEKFKVIEDQSQLAIIDKQLIKKIQNYEDVSWREIQNSSVRVREKILKNLAIQESHRYPGLWLWDAEYSNFLGYMEAVLKLEKISKDGFAIL
jgi:CRISPR/Cas system-associated endonuclease/helicase Cas3